MRNTGTGILPEDLLQATPVVSPLPSETTILCVTSSGCLLLNQNRNSSSHNVCLGCYSKLPAWRSQIHKGNHFLQFSRARADHLCHMCGIIIEKTRSPYSCKSCRDTLVRTINQFKTSNYDWNNFPCVARVVSELD